MYGGRIVCGGEEEEESVWDLKNHWIRSCDFINLFEHDNFLISDISRRCGIVWNSKTV